MIDELEIDVQATVDYLYNKKGKLMREQKNCPQCNRVIYFDGLCLDCREALERNTILALTDNEIEQKIKEICEELITKGRLTDNSKTFDLLFHLRNIDTTEIAKVAFENEIWNKPKGFNDPKFYKNALPEIISKMIDMILSDYTQPQMANNILQCLAVYGGQDVFDAFLECEKNPRKWREKLYVDPSNYALEGGFGFDKEGNYFETIYNTCYPIVKTTEKKDNAITLITITDDICTDCGCKYINLMEIDGRDKRLAFLNIDGVIKAKCCPNCTIETISRYEINGESIVLSNESSTDKNFLHEETLSEIPTYSLAKKDENIRYASYWGGGCSIGGFAGWVQYAEIKICPDCNKPMKYLAQVECDNLLDIEGNFYIEICTDCKIMAVIHQQT